MVPHIHIFKRLKTTKSKDFGLVEFQCTGHDCFFKKHAEELLGKQARCPKCEDVFQLDRESLRRAHPTCEGCRKGNKVEVGKYAGLARKLLVKTPAFVIPKLNLKLLETMGAEGHTEEQDIQDEELEEPEIEPGVEPDEIPLGVPTQ